MRKMEEYEDKCDRCGIDLDNNGNDNVIVSDFGSHCGEGCLNLDVEEFRRTHPGVMEKDLEEYNALQAEYAEHLWGSITAHRLSV